MGTSDSAMMASLLGATTVGHWVDGVPVQGISGRTADVFNPALGSVARSVSLANASEVDSAVQSSARAFSSWSATPPLRRARVMFKFKEIGRAHV